MEPLSTTSEEQPAAEEAVASPVRSAPPAWAVVAAAVLAVATVARLGFSLNSLAWAAVQVGVVGVTASDLTNRRVKNAVTIPVSALALLLRAAFERSAFVEVLVTGLVAFLAFFALALILRGGLGM